MNELFLHLYLDEDLSLLLAELLRSRNYRVTTTHEAGNLRNSDDAQLQFAAERGMTLVSHNRRHFEALAREYLEQGRSHAGIIVAVQRPEAEIARRLIRILDSFTVEEMKDQLLYV